MGETLSEMQLLHGTGVRTARQHARTFTSANTLDENLWEEGHGANDRSGRRFAEKNEMKKARSRKLRAGSSRRR